VTVPHIGTRTGFCRVGGISQFRSKITVATEIKLTMPRVETIQVFTPQDVFVLGTDERPRTGHGSGGALVLGASGTNGNAYFICKRWIDVILAGLLLVLLFPLLLLIAILIKLDSRGPVIFRHKRVGAKRMRCGEHTVWVWVLRTFDFYKFRSMFDGVDTAVHRAYIRDFVEGRLSAQEENAGQFKLTQDPRVTRVGRILRRASLDELPQLVNVLKGDMSLVGPRPVPPYEVACYRSADYDRLAAPPGITGLWQVQGRCRVPFEGMVQLDREYIRTASLWTDLKRLFQTIPAVLSGRGAE
jgi:lipopolysaccharide/colanic/teichoic acid biosynthesis glycosyltransferase